MNLMRCALLFLLLCHMPAHAGEHEAALPINDQTFLVYRRYYFIARLDRTIKLLAKFSQEAKAVASPLRTRHVIDELMHTPEMHQFNHVLIKDSVASMNQLRSLKPLFMVWDAFKSYKSLKDDLFVEDFSKEIFIITRTIAQHLHDEESIKSIPMDLNIVCRCDAISRLTEYIELCMQGTLMRLPLPERASDVSDLALNIHTDEVAFRYYALRRLHEAAQLMLSADPELQKSLHEAATAATNRSEQHKALRQRTFKQLWDDCQQYKFIDDSTFLHAFAVRLSLMLHAYHQQETPESAAPIRKLNYAQLMQIYQQINKMPIEEILTGIDFLVTNASAISNSYQKSGLSFTQWIKEYWWAPPMMIATVIFQCVKFYYKKYHPR
jgi:hypothetical protein